MNADLSQPDTSEPTDGNRSLNPLDFSPETRGRWEWSAEEIRRVGYQVVDLIADHLVKLPEQPVFQPIPTELAAAFLTTPRPAAGQAPEAILAEFAATIAPYPFGNGHPRFFGWVNSPPAVLSIFAEALAAAMNPSVAGGNHAAVYIERQVGRWFAELLGFPATSMGLLVSGGSMATLTGLTVARQVKAGWDVRADGLQGATPRLIVYTSVEGHGCARKAVEMLGIGGENLRLVAADEAGRMRVAELEAAVGQDRAGGHRPIAVVASAGTVNTGAIDPLTEIADLCRRHDLWLHVDGAYGAPAILTRRYREELAPLSLADSVALDPHKWLYVPVEAGLVLVRDAEALRDTFSLVPPYLRTDGSPTGVGGPPWLSEFGFQQTRGFRALKVWMALKHHGINGYAEAIEHDCALAGYLAERIAESPDLELLTANLSIVCFRYLPRGFGHEVERLNPLNQAILRDLQLGGRAFLSSTMLDGCFVLRACIVNPRTTIADIEILVDTVETLGARLAEKGEIR